MVSIDTIAAVDFALGATAVVGLLYLLYTQTAVVHYPRFFRLITSGLLVYAATGPVFGRFAPAYIHLVHGIAALFVTAGLWSLVSDDVRQDEDFRAIVGADADDLGYGDDAFGFDDD